MNMTLSRLSVSSFTTCLATHQQDKARGGTQITAPSRCGSGKLVGDEPDCHT